MALSLFRKYRPQVFEDVVGQDHVERTLVNAIAEGTVSHAYLFCGPRGTGKTTTARLLAKALLCSAPEGKRPDGTCDECLAIAEGRHPDVYELDAASRTGVDNVREEIIGRVQYAPTRGNYKVYIIDEVHMLSTAAFNALLKTLEEPPAHVVFILCTTDPQKVPATILSRCQRFDFHRFSLDELTGRLRYICEQEGIAAEPEALSIIARRSQGGMRDAIGSLEQLATFTGSNITKADAEGLLGEVGSLELFDIVDLIADRDVAGCFGWIAKFVEGGTDMMQFARDLTTHVRNLYVTALTGAHDGIVEADENTIAMYADQAAAFGGPDRIARILTILGELLIQLKTATDPRLNVEIAFTRMARPTSDLTLEALAERIEALELRLDALDAGEMRPRPARRRPEPEPVLEAAPSSEPEPAPVPSPRPQPKLESAPKLEPAPRLQPDPAPEPAPAAPRGPLSVDDAQRLWTAAVRAIRTKRSAIASSFVGTVVDVAADGALKIGFPSQAVFAIKLASRPENRETVAEAIRETFGQDLPFTYELSQGAAQPTSVPRPEPAPRLEPVPEPHPNSAPRPEPAPKPAPAPAPASAPEPVFEEVPLDAYDGFVESYDEPPIDIAPAFEPEPAPAPEPAMAPEPAPQPASAPVIDPAVMLDPNWDPEEAWDDVPAYDDDPEDGGIPTPSAPDGLDPGVASLFQGAFGGGVSFASADDE